MNLVNSVKSKVLYSFGLSLVRVVTMLYAMILIIRYFDNTQYAVIVLLTGMSGILRTLTSFGYNHYITRFITKSTNDKKIASLYWNIVIKRLFVGCCAVLILGVTFPFYASKFGIDGYYPHTVWALLTVIFTIFSFYNHSLLNAQFKQNSIFYIDLFFFLSKALSITIIVYYKGSLLDLIQVYAILEGLRSIIGSILILFYYGLPNLHMNLKKIEDFEGDKYRRHSYFTQITNFLTRANVDRYILAYFSNNFEVAVYGVASSILQRVSNVMPIKMFYPLLEPAIYARYDIKNNKNELNKIFNFIFIIVNFVLLLSITVFYVMGDELLKVVFVKDYAIEAFWPILILLFSLLAYSIPVGIIVKAIKKTKILMYAQLIGLLSFTVGIPMAIYFGALGIAISTAIFTILRNVVMFVMVRKYVSLVIKLRPVLVLILSSIITIVVLTVVGASIHLNIFVQFTLVIIIYLILVKNMKLFCEDNQRILFKFIPNKISNFVRYFLIK
jgi:O-antigen/teichoic acid export membrane protein